MVMDLATLTQKSVVAPQSVDANGTGGGAGANLIIRMSGIADSIPAWGDNQIARDAQLRAFWPTEPIVASAIGSTIMRYAAFGWTLNGGPRTVNIVRNILHSVDMGAGWIPFMQKVLLDFFTQDNGAFIEIVRTDNDANAPVISLNHLDSAQCKLTGDPEIPVFYFDRKGKAHALRYYQVIHITDMPSPIERFYGQQYCALTRMLAAAQVARDISTYKSEKLSGRYHRSIHLVSGVQARTINDALEEQRLIFDARGTVRYIQPAIIASLDPTARVSHAQVDLAGLPDGFDEEVWMRWYINQMALAMGSDYQDYAPLPGGNLGTSAQSEVLHLKSRGKGPALFMRMLEQRFNMHGIIPRNVTFSFGEQDVSENLELAKLRMIRAQTRAMQISSGEITPEMARQIAVDEGDLEIEYLRMIGEDNATPDTIVSSSV